MQTSRDLLDDLCGRSEALVYEDLESFLGDRGLESELKGEDLVEDPVVAALQKRGLEKLEKDHNGSEECFWKYLDEVRRKFQRDNYPALYDSPLNEFHNNLFYKNILPKQYALCTVLIYRLIYQEKHKNDPDKTAELEINKKFGLALGEKIYCPPVADSVLSPGTQRAHEKLSDTCNKGALSSPSFAEQDQLQKQFNWGQFLKGLALLVFGAGITLAAGASLLTGFGVTTAPLAVAIAKFGMGAAVLGAGYVFVQIMKAYPKEKISICKAIEFLACIGAHPAATVSRAMSQIKNARDKLKTTSLVLGSLISTSAGAGSSAAVGLTSSSSAVAGGAVSGVSLTTTTAVATAGVMGGFALGCMGGLTMFGQGIYNIYKAFPAKQRLSVTYESDDDSRLIVEKEVSEQYERVRAVFGLGK